MTEHVDAVLSPAWTANPATGTRGRETEWLAFTTLSVESGQLMIGDASYLPDPDACLALEVQPGTYTISVKVMDYGTDKRISRLRIARAGAEPELGRKAGAVWADVGRTGVCDAERFGAVEPLKDEQRWTETIGAALDAAETHGVATFEGVEMPFVSSGFGDGEFPVYPLKSGGEPVGAEVQFIKPTERYPF
ncbi:MAG TPA: hypothetical protein VFT45_11585 [Longimicrobium sp.]|nr:hypothetical protein [Longimicrobium sp.]